MLPGVLLHVIVPARPINFCVYLTRFNGTLQNVGDAALFVYDLNNPLTAYSSQIEGLPTRCRIEGCTIQVDPPVTIGGFHDVCLKLAQVTV